MTTSEEKVVTAMSDGVIGVTSAMILEHPPKFQFGVRAEPFCLSGQLHLVEDVSLLTQVLDHPDQLQCWNLTEAVGVQQPRVNLVVFKDYYLGLELL